jgi:hypothetical protein
MCTVKIGREFKFMSGKDGIRQNEACSRQNHDEDIRIGTSQEMSPILAFYAKNRKGSILLSQTQL